RITQFRPGNRFQAMDETLVLLRHTGYSPRVVIDGGANMGLWTEMVRPIFPAASFHLIEPQPACAPALQELARRMPRLHLHRVALTEPGVTRVRMVGGGWEGGGTGAWVARDGEAAPGEVECPAATLDVLLAEAVSSADRALLKLDLEGHEMSALQGASRLLQAVEVILTELQFYEINENKRPVFGDMLNFLRDRGFELYDFACLSQRPRDMRLRMGDVVFVRQDSSLLADRSWE
ncbi:MAG: FkbM family methyltransferase, partial [Candidatus Binatia bacterium]